MVTLRCTCGETFQADDAHIGKGIRCRCGRIVEIAAAPVLASSPVRPPPSSPQEARGTQGGGPRAPQRRASRPARLTVPATLLLVVLLVLWAGTRVDTSGPSSSPVGTAVRPEVDPVEALSRARQTLSTAAPPDRSCPSESVIRPRSSQELGGAYRGGLSSLRIVNGTSLDAVAVLVEALPAQPRRAIYIRANETGRITQIPPGVYQLQFQLGSSWPSGGSAFCQIRGTSEFDRSLPFEERETDDGVEYSNAEVTLHPVPQGTATTHIIPPSAFRLPPP